MIYDIKARLRHLFGYHTPVHSWFLDSEDIRNPGIWCYVCGKRLL